jgi:hypothetical protein
MGRRHLGDPSIHGRVIRFEDENWIAQNPMLGLCDNSHIQEAGKIVHTVCINRTFEN